MKTINVWIFIAVTSGLTHGRLSAYAQPASDPLLLDGDDKPWSRGVPLADRQAARDLFLKGNHLFKIPLITQAIEQYTAALNKLKHPAIYFNLALAQLSLGEDVEAHDNLERALQYGEGPLKPEEVQEARKQLQDLERKLGRISVRCQTSGAEVTLDGVPLFAGPGSHQVWVTATAHEITAKKLDYLSEARRVTVGAGEQKSLDLKLITLSEAEDGSRRWATWKPWAVVGAGAAVAATAGVLHTLSFKAFHSYDDEFLKLPCIAMQDPKSPGCAITQIPSPLNSKLRTAEREQNIAVAGYIAGGSLIAAGAVLLYLNRQRLIEQEDKTAPVGRVAFAPAISTNMLGILLTVSH